MKPQILRDLRFLFSLVVACGPAGVPGAAWGRAAPWAAARPLAVRAASLRLGASPRSPARPRHRPLAPRQIPPAPFTPAALCRWSVLVCRLEARPGPVPRSVPYPQFRMQFPDTCSSSLSEKPGISTITFQSMKCAWGNCMRICADQAPPPLTGTAAWSLYSLWASWGSRVLSFWGAQVRVVTNVVNPSAFSVKMVVFGLRLTTFVTGVLARRFELRWFDDVCNVSRPLVARPGPAAGHGYRIWVL